MTIAQSILEVKAKIKKAQESEFAAKDVLLIAVSKTKPLELIKEALTAGISDFGENRVQELMGKQPYLPELNWHLIGTLQTNKVKYLFDGDKARVKLIHSLDRLELAKELDKRAERAGLVMPVLVQVNIADEDTKSGIKENEAGDFILALQDFPHIQVKGLMTIGPFLPDPEELRPVFRSLRLLSQDLDRLAIPHIRMEYLSMGMSNDYMVAVEEGANLVRVGSTIFGNR